MLPGFVDAIVSGRVEHDSQDNNAYQGGTSRVYGQ